MSEIVSINEVFDLDNTEMDLIMDEILKEYEQAPDGRTFLKRMAETDHRYEPSVRRYLWLCIGRMVTINDLGNLLSGLMTSEILKALSSLYSRRGGER